MTHRLFLISILVILGVSAGHAQEVTDSATIVSEIESAGSITVSLPEGLAKWLVANVQTKVEQDTDAEESQKMSTRHSTRVGYRVQVFDDNNVRTAKHDAEVRKSQIQARFPEFDAYIQFNSPYWRVKVGDFKTRSEAEAAMGAIRAAFPSLGNQLRIVRDHIRQPQ